MTIMDMHHFSGETDRPFVSLRELTIATAAALLVFVGAAYVIKQATAPEGPMVTPLPVAEKTDRLPLGGEEACKGQTWGGWSQTCLKAVAASRGADTFRLISSETIETRVPETNTSILTRQPING